MRSRLVGVTNLVFACFAIAVMTSECDVSYYPLKMATPDRCWAPLAVNQASHETTLINPPQPTIAGHLDEWKYQDLLRRSPDLGLTAVKETA